MVSRLYLRVVFVLVGAALALAFMLLDVTLIALMIQDTNLPMWFVVLLGTVLVVTPLVALGLVPAIRTIEGVAVQSLLGVELPGGPPGPAMTWPQRGRTLAWFVLHLVVGAVLVAGVVAMIGVGASWWLPLLIVLVMAGGVGLGELMARLAPRMLGPSYADRLVLLERDMDRATERNRIAREIHDSVGHALSLVTVQAAAARTVIERDPAFTVSALTAIEAAAREAAADLDHVLGLLREDSTDRRTSGPDLRSLDALLLATRSAGLDISCEIDGDLAARDGDLTTLPTLVSREAYRIVQEALTNALRYSADDTALLQLRRSPDALRIRVTNQAGRDPERRAGRGLAGIDERVQTLGGSFAAGPDLGGSWLLEADLPLAGVRR